ILTANREALQLSAARFQPAIGVIEADDSFVSFHFEACVNRAGVFDLFSISNTARSQRQAGADRLFLFRMDIVLLTYIRDLCQSNICQHLSCEQLGFAQLSPITLP